MYKLYGRQAKHDPDYRGIVGIINVPYSVMIPIHSKQAFKNEDEYKILKSAVEKYMDQYVRDIKEELKNYVKNDSLREFWQDYGYLDEHCDIPSKEGKYVRKRLFKLPTVVQCDYCLKWRMWNNSSADENRQIHENWCCENLTNCK